MAGLLLAVQYASGGAGEAKQDSLAPFIERIAEGDRIALKDLYDATAPRLFAVALRAMRKPDQAEDVLQEVFVTVWNKAHLFDRAKGNAHAWLYAITRRKTIDALRKSARESTGVLGDVAGNTFPVDAPYWVGPETGMTLQKCIKALKPDVQQALALCFIEGHSHEDAARHMQVPLGTVKSWIRRALEVIRQDLSRQDVRKAA